jgi:hypothetical protein
MKILKILESADREFRIELFERADGCFQHRTSEVMEYNGEHQWLPTGTSGLYASFEDADRAALDELRDAERPN